MQRIDPYTHPIPIALTGKKPFQMELSHPTKGWKFENRPTNFQNIHFPSARSFTGAFWSAPFSRYDIHFGKRPEGRRPALAELPRWIEGETLILTPMG